MFSYCLFCFWACKNYLYKIKPNVINSFYIELKLNIVANGLTKQKALAIEKFLIVKNSKTLWNIKDNPDINK
jgi:hypothetical protein